MKMEDTYSSESSVDFQVTTRRCITEDRTILTNDIRKIVICYDTSESVNRSQIDIKRKICDIRI
jgi:hypothetical protein